MVGYVRSCFSVAFRPGRRQGPREAQAEGGCCLTGPPLQAYGTRPSLLSVAASITARAGSREAPAAKGADAVGTCRTRAAGVWLYRRTGDNSGSESLERLGWGATVCGKRALKGANARASGDRD